MFIDNFYDKIDKSNFYLGMVSQVYRENSVVQVENLSWLSHRKIKSETLIPNTINYFVIVDSIQGLFIGEVYQSKVAASESVHDSMNNGVTEDVYPELSIDVIGVMKSNGNTFELAGFHTVGITDKVYIANERVIEMYLNSIEIKYNSNISESPLSSFANFSKLENQSIYLKPSTLFDRHIMAVGTTNSGKSTSALSILDKLVRDQKKVLIVDPTGEYSNSFTESTQEDLEGEVCKLRLGTDTVLPVGEVSNQQWAMLFETNDATQPAVLADAIKSLRYQKKNKKVGIYEKENQLVTNVKKDMASVGDDNKDFELNDLPKQIAAETNKIGKNGKNTIYQQNDFNFNSNQWLVQKVQYKLANTSLINFFNNDGSKKNLLQQLDAFLQKPNSALYIDTSAIGTDDAIGGVIIDLISNYLINKQRDEISPFVFFVDEVHRYTKAINSESDYYTGLTSIAREGRKKGIFLFLTTQNPQDVPDTLLGQIGTLLIHRLTHVEEIRTIQNHLKANSLGQIKKLDKGEAILTSINLLQDLNLKVVKSGRIHENETPSL
ncbi:HerA helicase [Tetragenococcus halophilus]|uniref:ATP-binding protein n=1 Tax=Tetragenococcus halophilus TaxID=51669 RepID=UPI00083E56B7|nr:ATP-binding protein [Tetragenococcus halophilus]AOF48263.1 HerA helicase [Tetragenococcus halophilus]